MSDDLQGKLSRAGGALHDAGILLAGHEEPADGIARLAAESEKWQTRAEQLHRLLTRQKKLDEVSPAARNLEQRDIDRIAAEAELTTDVQVGDVIFWREKKSTAPQVLRNVVQSLHGEVIRVNDGVHDSAAECLELPRIKIVRQEQPRPSHA